MSAVFEEPGDQPAPKMHVAFLERHLLAEIEATKREAAAEAAHLRQVMDERDRLYSTQFKTSETAVLTAMTAAEKAVNAAFLASEKAIVKAEDAQREYNIRSNEFRGQLDDQAKTLMPRPETMTIVKGLEDKIAVMQTNFDNRMEAQRVSNEKVFENFTKEIAGLRESRSGLQGQGAGQQAAVTDQRANIATIVGLVLVVLAILGYFATH